MFENCRIAGLAPVGSRALALLYESLKPLDADIVNCIHDEIVVEASEAHAEECAAILERKWLRQRASLCAAYR